MKISLQKFGTTLTSRESGREALAAFRSNLDRLAENEKIIIDFFGVNTFSPSWADEFLTPLYRKYPNNIRLKNDDNLSVKATLDILYDFQGTSFRGLK